MQGNKIHLNIFKIHPKKTVWRTSYQLILSRESNVTAFYAVFLILLSCRQNKLVWHEDAREFLTVSPVSVVVSPCGQVASWLFTWYCSENAEVSMSLLNIHCKLCFVHFKFISFTNIFTQRVDILTRHMMNILFEISNYL